MTLGALTVLASQTACYPFLDLTESCAQEQVGTSWCEGKTRFACEGPGKFGQDPELSRDYCSAYSETCQMVTSRGVSSATCVVPDEHCEAGQTRCRGGWLMQCLDGFWVRELHCGSSEQCVEDPATGARCATPPPLGAPWGGQ